MKRILTILLILSFTLTTLMSKAKLEKLYSLPKSLNISYMMLDVKSDSPILTLFDENERPVCFNIYILKKNNLEMRFKNVTDGTYSPDGNYYTYVKNEDAFCIFSKNNKLVKQILIRGMVENVTWSYDSNYVYFCTQDDDYIIHQFNVKNGEYQVVLKSHGKYFHPITVKDTNILYLLENKDPESVEAYNCNIIRYYLKEKRFEKVKLPAIDKLWINSSFTVSPDNKTIIFEDFRTGLIHVVDLTTNKILDSLNIPANIDTSIGFYCWKPDSSYVLFTVTLKEIYKYSFK